MVTSRSKSKTGTSISVTCGNCDNVFSWNYLVQRTIHQGELPRQWMVNNTVENIEQCPPAEIFKPYIYALTVRQKGLSEGYSNYITFCCPVCGYKTEFNCPRRL